MLKQNATLRGISEKSHNIIWTFRFARSLKKSHYALRGVDRRCTSVSPHMAKARNKTASVRE